MKKNITVLAAALALLAPVSSHALELTLPVYARHALDVPYKGGNWNPNTYGIGVETEDHAVMGGYYNSFYKYSAYVGYAWRPLEYKRVTAGIVAGLISGYKYPVMAMFSVKAYIYEGVAIEFLAVPTITRDGTTYSGVGAVQLVLPLNF